MTTVPLQICNSTDRCCKRFIILYSLFSLISLHFFFSLLSHSPVPSLFNQFGMFTVSDDGVAPKMTARSTTLDLAPATQSHSSHSISPTLDLADLTPRPPSISHLATLQPLYPSLVVGFFFFFRLQFGLILWWWWAVGYGWWQWQWWWAVGVMALSSLFESMAICLFELVLNQCWISDGLAFGWWLCLVIGICWFFFFPCFVGGFCLARCVMVGWWWLLLPCWAYVVVKWWLVAVVAWWLVFVCCWWLR